jgi:hypothetical protein
LSIPAIGLGIVFDSSRPVVTGLAALGVLIVALSIVLFILHYPQDWNTPQSASAEQTVASIYTVGLSFVATALVVTLAGKVRNQF